MLKDKLLLSYLFLLGAMGGILFSFYAEAPFMFIVKLGLSTFSYGAICILVALGNILGAPLSRFIVNKRGCKKAIYFSLPCCL